MADPGTSDAELLALIDDPRAFESFYRRHLQAVLRFATRRCHGTGLTRDPWELGFSLLVAPVPPDVRAALYRGLAALPA